MLYLISLCPISDFVFLIDYCNALVFFFCNVCSINAQMMMMMMMWLSTFYRFPIPKFNENPLITFCVTLLFTNGQTDKQTAIKTLPRQPVAQANIQTRWMYCVKCPLYSIRLEALIANVIALLLTYNACAVVTQLFPVILFNNVGVAWWRNQATPT